MKKIFIKNQKKIILVVLILLFFFYYSADNGTLEEEKDLNVKRQVELISIEDFLSAGEPLPLVGEINSKSEVVLRAESAGEIIELYKSEGDYIGMGDIVAKIDNKTQLAGLTQAQALVDLRKADLKKLKAGLRQEELDILRISKDSSFALLKQEKDSIVNNIKANFISAYDGINNNIDKYFVNPNTENPKFNFVVSESDVQIAVERLRRDAELALISWKESIDLLSAKQDLNLKLDEAEINLLRVRDFLDKSLSITDRAYSGYGIADGTSEDFKKVVASVRLTVNASLAYIENAKASLKAKESKYNIDSKQYEQALNGAREEDILSAEAALSQAIASLTQAQIALDKTLIKSPITGDINILNIEKGDFVALFEDIALVSNSDVLEVVSYIGSEDRANIKVGANAKIDKRYKGVVSEIASMQDLKIKKIKIKIAILDKDVVLSNGQSVNLEVEKSSNELSDNIVIPISAIKITPEGEFVFSLNDDNTLKANEVKLGPIIGSGITIIEGVSYDSEIVKDARALRDGQKVDIK